MPVCMRTRGATVLRRRPPRAPEGRPRRPVGPFFDRRNPGDGEARVAFPESMLDRVADLLQARRKRRMTPEAREEAAARLERTRFRPHSAPRS
jgi:hypothetical protein